MGKRKIYINLLQSVMIKHLPICSKIEPKKKAEQTQKSQKNDLKIHINHNKNIVMGRETFDDIFVGLY